ncbi:hypothetical protein CVT24_008989 [Panaeolus cyanescens]|uniref:Hydrophobin n=1 Tax=Panaeolus cyanescens TaxID=181874 RepID=A0A409YAQ4_9AGAR|nr:hypothetical protein CVT24_008989 [Panaeolus cyanescens]
MFNRVISFVFFFLFALPLFAAAMDIEEVDELLARDGNCNTGNIQCCNSTMENNSTSLSQLSSLLGIALPSIAGLLGLGCNPISILGLGGNSCSAQPVCCSNNQFTGLISLGCMPINIGL